MFTVAKMNGPAIIVKRKKDEKVLAWNTSMVKKYKYISDSDDHSDIDSSGSTEMNTENTHPDNRGINTDNVENIESANNVRLSSRTRNPPIRFGKICRHWKKIWRWGGYLVYAMDFGCTLYMLYMDFVYTLDNVVYIFYTRPFLWIEISTKATLQWRGV